MILSSACNSTSACNCDRQWILVQKARKLCSIPSPLELWNSPVVTGEAPPPCFNFTLTALEENRAALFGGLNGSGTECNDLYIAELKRDSVVSVCLYRFMEKCLCTDEHLTSIAETVVAYVQKHKLLLTKVVQKLTIFKQCI